MWLLVLQFVLLGVPNASVPIVCFGVLGKVVLVCVWLYNWGQVGVPVLTLVVAVCYLCHFCVDIVVGSLRDKGTLGDVVMRGSAVLGCGSYVLFCFLLLSFVLTLWL